MNNTNLIFGAPGCGKTTYLLNLLEDILKSNDPDRVAFVSFTRKGSYEGRDRAIEKFNYSEDDFPYFRTLHSIAFRNLHVSKYDMISKANYKEFSKAMGMNFVGYYTEDFTNNDDKYLFMQSLERNNLSTFDKYLDLIDFNKYKMIKHNYERYKAQMGIKDFDDLIEEFIKKKEPLPVDVAIIDEAQDLTSMQWKFCEIAFKNCETVYIAGDDDQAIYEWSGADIKKFLSFKSSSNVVILDRSYRLRKNILEFSKTITSQIIERVDKTFSYDQEGGTISFYNRVEDVPINSEESYYFLSRNNYFLSGFRQILLRKGLIFSHKDKLSVDPQKFNAIKRYEKYRKESPDKIKKDLIISSFLRKDRRGDYTWFEVFDMDTMESNYYRDLFKNKVDINVPSKPIHINTIHGVKGGEADNVVLKLDMTRQTYMNFNSAENRDSELRCLYVGITRTRKNLHIIYPNSKFGYEDIFKEVV